MCGIFAYTGQVRAAPQLLEGLRALEYRGYDSAGIYCGGDEQAYKTLGEPAGLAGVVPEHSATAGIAHTRWATHGAPSQQNAHPHPDQHRRIWVVHNGIIENYRDLRAGLEQAGHTFLSDTDSEVLAHCIGRAREQTETLADAVASALAEVRGAYGIAVMESADPHTIVGARMGSPLVIGVGSDEHYLASDAAPISRYTSEVVYLSDGDIAVLTPSQYRITTHAREPVDRQRERITWRVADLEKGGYPHFMLKEIMEGPSVVADAMRGRLQPAAGEVKLGGLDVVQEQLQSVGHVRLVGCGSAYYAAQIGAALIEAYAGIPAHAELASEFRYRTSVLERDTAVIAVSQSGETADTLAAVREAQRRGLLTLGVVNVVGSTIARETDAGVYNHAGPEISVASTKAFLSQATVLALIAVLLGRQRGLGYEDGRAVCDALHAAPDALAEALTAHDAARAAAGLLAEEHHALYLGRTTDVPVAYEGALKCKEVSYVHAEGYAAGEMKHGPLALIATGVPVVAIAGQSAVYEKMRSNIEEVRARGAAVIAVADADDADIAAACQHVLPVPRVHPLVRPLVHTVPLQLLAYEIGVARGIDVDKPRNLAKSVTVE